jgi:ABC-2 type transport system ATP-binding protein
VGIAQALLGEPEIIILDEPTVGLDPRQMIEIRELIKNLGKTHTVILSSHILSEVQAVCQQVMIINKGKLMAFESTENLEKRFAGTTAVELVAEATETEIRNILSPVQGIAKIEVRQQPDNTRRVYLELNKAADNALCREIFFAFSRAGKAILQMTTTKASLEDIFLELTGKTGKKGGKKG